ncbi:MAG: type VI secretion system baseplate subunit TssG [Acidobacteria bacterium]|nr:type VI secretion system baseplate subunit TssG [Acidobacteriota bacterium]
MSDGTRQETAPLSRRIFEEGCHLDFFQAVHLLQNWYGDGVRIGELGPPPREKLRLRPDETLRFSPGDIRSLEPPDADSGMARITVNFMGLYGVSAPTPVYLTEMIGVGGRDAKPLVDFLDLFNHRLLSLFFRAWLKYRFPYRYEAGAKDAFSGFVLAFVGLNEPSTHPLTELPVQRLLKYVGLSALQTRPPVNLQRVLSDYFGGLPIGIREFVHRWVTIPPHQLNRIGEVNSTIGADLSVGNRVPDREGKIRIEVGPVGYDEYLRLLPGTKRFHDLCALIRVWSFERYDFDIQIEIKREEVPPSQLDVGSPPQLGRTSWAVTPEGGLAENPKIIFRRPQRAA